MAARGWGLAPLQTVPLTIPGWSSLMTFKYSPARPMI